MQLVHKTGFHISLMVRMIVFTILTTIIYSSCTCEMEESGVVMDKEIHFTIRLPYSPEALRNRSITESEENYISSIYILSFGETNGNERFNYWCEAKPAVSNMNGLSYQNYSAVLKVRNHPQRLVLLANISDQLKQEIRQRNWEGMEKEQMLSQLEEIMDSPDNKWNAASVSDYRALPMWGESIPVIINTNTTGLNATIPLLRMVARIDVQLDETTIGLTDKFRLGSVRLYNTNTKGSVVPDANNIQVVLGNIEILIPTIPAEITDYSHRHFGPVLYEDFSYPGQQYIAIRNAIYLFETEAAENPLEATCLVIGGYYENDTEQTFYRVDFMNEEGQRSLPILRNHKYTINIVDVKQYGYKNPDDAFHSKGEGMEVSLLHWNEIDIDEIWFDQVYYYSISPRLFEPQEAGSTGNRIRVDTDYPNWSFKVSHNSNPAANSTAVSWLTITSHQAGQKYPGSGTVDYIVFNVESSNVNVRTAYIHVTAGRVTMTATVKQTHWATPYMAVSPTGTIPSNGQVRRVKATGIFVTIDLRVRESANNSILRTGQIRAGVNNNSLELTIPAWPERNRTRQVYIEYLNPITDKWIVIQEDTQISFYWD